jgi:hypothetical protein
MRPADYAIFLISIILSLEGGVVIFPVVALCRRDPTKYGLVNAALALNLLAGS